MPQTNEPCVYCGKVRTFNEEHVFPAGMGGDDRSYLLVNTVCKSCNDNFSKFEATLMRRSIVALARTLHQPHGRRKGKPPELDTLETHIIDIDGNLVESHHRGQKIETLAQLVFSDNKIETSANSQENLKDFINKLSNTLLQNSLFIIEKIHKNKPEKYQVSEYALTNNKHVLKSKFSAKNLPKHRVWLNFNSRSNDKVKQAYARIFQKPNGELTLKTYDHTLIEKILNTTLETLPKIIALSDNVKEVTIENPLVSSTAHAWSPECDRAIAKIGLNLLIHHLGKESVATSAFSSIKKSILSGTPSLPISLFSNKTIKEHLFANIPNNHHCLLLAPINIPGQKSLIVFIAFLYGTIGLYSTLTDDVDASLLLNPTYFLVNYLDNRITCMSAVDYHIKYDSMYKNILQNSNWLQFGSES